MKKVVGIVIVVVSTVIALWLSCSKCSCRQDVEDGYRSSESRSSAVNDPYDICKCSPRFARSYVKITEAQSNAVLAIYRTMKNAYTNGQISVMRQEMARVPDVMTNVYESAYIEITRAFREAYTSRFLYIDEPSDFESVDAFASYIEINLLVARFEGEMWIRRGNGTCLLPFEVFPLRLLTKYKAKYHAEGKKDFERAADRFLAQLKESIDSEQGFTRWYMWFQVDLQWPHVGEGGWTAQTVENFVKEYAKPLIKLGHTPNWLQEFDNLQEPEWSKEWDAKHGIRR